MKFRRPDNGKNLRGGLRRRDEDRYAYFWTGAPAQFEEIARGGGWSPDGHGFLTQAIIPSGDGKFFGPEIKYEVFDQSGKPTERSSMASAKGIRMEV